MRLKLVPVFVASVAVVLLSAASARACSCAGSKPPCEAYGAAAAVFVGTVTGARGAPPPQTAEEKKWAEEEREPRGYRFAVTQAFSGVAGTEVEVWTGRGSGDCGYRFKTGASYLVYAYRMEKSGRLATNICLRTRPAADAAEDLEFLRGLAGGPPGVNIAGTVTRRHTDFEREVGREPMRGASVLVEGGGESRETSTDARGHFFLSGLKAGTYKVKLLLPEELAAWRPERELTVADRGCAVVEYDVIDNGRVSGVVTDGEGRPAARVRVTLADADDPELKRGHGKTVSTDEEGRYAFDEMPPGRYLLAVNLLSLPEYGDPTHAFPRVYYPSASRPADAEVLTLGAGAELRGRDLRLPPRRAERAVEITVVWADGRPVAGALIIMRDETYHNRGYASSARADAEGRFRLNGYEGQTYVVEARSDPPYYERGAPTERTEPLTVNLSEQQGPLILVITKIR